MTRREHSAKYYKEHREERCAAQRRYNAKYAIKCAERAKLYRARHVDDCFFRTILKNYGLTRTLWEQLRDGGCWLCHESFNNTKRRFIHVDHDHTTGQVRGLTHNLCNMIIGAAHDNPNFLRTLANSLEAGR